MSGSTGTNSNAPIRAAGGIVWRLSPDPAVAIVHRPQYNDWVLPKGKLRPGEAALAAARREVKEETGHEVSVHEFLGSIAYEVAGHPKVVHFWRMEVRDEPAQELKADVDHVDWLPLEAAARKLTHPLERDFLKTAGANAVAISPRRTRRGNFFARLFDTSAARLRQSIMSYEVELNRVAATSTSSDQNWAPSALLLLTRAQEAVDEGDAEAGWHCFKAATRMELYGLPDDERHSRAIRLLAEAREKLGSWRTEAITQMLLTDGSLKGNPPASAIAAAAQLLHENEDNRYRLLRIRWRHFAILGAFAVFFLGVVVLSMPARDDALNLFHPLTMFHFAALGAMGAAISGIMRVGSDSPSARRIPDELSAFGVLIARLAVGAGVAVLLVALWHAGILNVATNIAQKPEFATAIAIAAGFSERFAQNAIERLTSAPSRDQSSVVPTSPKK